MAVEFTKALLSNPNVIEGLKIHEHEVGLINVIAIRQANMLIKSLNEEGLR